jgi:serine/threonine protein kinase
MTVGFQAGDVLRDGQYEIQRLLRRARDKDVYLAHDRVLGFEVAIDVFASNNTVMPNGQRVSAWEARVLGQLGSHPNIASAQGYWVEDGMPLMATRYLSGGTLRDLIRQSQECGESLPAGEVLRIAAEIAQGLAHIHGRRILYRDLQPSNVLFDEWGTVHLVDFDTAALLDDPAMNDVSGRSAIGYMAPELIAGGPADERADLYSLGATMQEMITGQPPFNGTREEILAAHCKGSRPSLDQDDIADATRDLVLCLLAPQRDHRPASAAEVADRIKALSATREEIALLLTKDESATLEFKSSFRKNCGPNEPADKRPGAQGRAGVGRKVLETVAAFHNTFGGTLVIGVSDDRKVVGIENEYPPVSSPRDGWRLAFDDVISRHLGGDAMSSIDLHLEPWDGHTIAIVRCTQRREPTWLDGDLHVRRTASTEKLCARDALGWCRDHWG